MEQVKERNIFFDAKKNSYFVRIMINHIYYMKSFKNMEDATKYRDELILQHRAIKDERPIKSPKKKKDYTFEELQEKHEKEAARRRKYYEKNKEKIREKYQQNKERIKELEAQ